MANIIDAADVGNIKDKKILFDTNVWIFIEGLNGQSFRDRQDAYTKAWSLLKQNNSIIVNEYVISELCNRAVKLEYDIQRKSSEDPKTFMSFKTWRGTDDFKHIVSVTADTCSNIIEDCEFCSCYDKHYSIQEAITEYSNAKMDLIDIIVRSHCQFESYMIMTDDSDYADCEIDLITANRRLLSARR